MICKNCAQEFEGNYCPECGQKASTKRFTTRFLLKDIVKKVFPIDKGVWFTTRRLITAPGPMVREYLDGKRVNYTKPLQYLLLIVTISLLLFSKQQFEQGFRDGLGTDQDAKVTEVQMQIMEFIFSHFSLVFLSILPFLAYFSKRLFRKHEVNYAEHLVLNCYIMAACSIASMPFTFIINLMGKNPFAPFFTAISSLIYVGFLTWAYLGFFKPQNKWIGGLKAILAILLAYVTYILVLGLVVAVGLGVYFFIWGK